MKRFYLRETKLVPVPEDEVIETREQSVQPKARPVIIEGVYFKSAYAAAAHFQMTQPRLRYRLKSKSKKFVNWNWA